MLAFHLLPDSADAMCPAKTTSHTCTCRPKCKVCGFGPHMAVHLPGKTRDGKTTEFYDHKYEPKESTP